MSKKFSSTSIQTSDDEDEAQMNKNPINLKTKLNKIWDDLQSNLPEINFNEDDDDNNLDLNIRNDHLNDHKDEYFRDVLYNDDNENPESSILTSNYLNNNLIDEEMSNSLEESLNSKLKTLSSKLNESHLANTTAANHRINNSIESAERITKNIFASKNSKLSMDIFNAINIDDLLNSVSTKTNISHRNHKTSNHHHSNNLFDIKANQNHKTSKTSTLSNNDDERILKKLAEMSMKISNDTRLSNLDVDTGAISTKSFMTSTDDSNDLFKSRNPFELMEKELKNNQSRSNRQSRHPEADDEITKDLKQFLKSHNIKDGNLVETRRIDLRASQNMNYDGNKKIYSSKSKAESLFDSLTIQSVNNNREMKTTKKLKYLNENTSDEESSSSESDDDERTNDRALWIERYRKQKFNNNEKN